MITLTRIEMALISGRKPGDLPEKADSASKLMRAWIHLVRGQIREHRGDREKAIQSFQKASEILALSFVSKLADSRIEALTSKGTDAKKAEKAVDPVIRRKKKRRR